MSAPKPTYQHHVVRDMALQKLELEDRLNRLEETHRRTVRWIAQQGLDIPREFIQPMYKH